MPFQHHAVGLPRHSVKVMAHRAFTLIEVITVTAIVGIVAGILAIALIQARDRAASTSHVSAMRQMVTATILYGEANNFPQDYLKFASSGELLALNKQLLSSNLLAFRQDQTPDGWGNGVREEHTYTGRLPFTYSPFGLGDLTTIEFVRSNHRYSKCIQTDLALFIFPTNTSKSWFKILDPKSPPSVRTILRARTDGSVARAVIFGRARTFIHPYEAFGTLDDDCSAILSVDE